MTNNAYAKNKGDGLLCSILWLGGAGNQNNKSNMAGKFIFIEEKLDMPDARQNIKIDRAHRVGRKRDSRRKPRAIVAKFIFFPDREKIRRNARKLKGTRIGISEQFPEEIEKVRQKLYPEMRRAKAEKQRVRLVRDKRFINNVEFIPDNSYKVLR